MKYAIIGGTGVDELDSFASLKSFTTEYGAVDYAIIDDIVFLPRHSSGHSVPPHMINYKANIALLKDLEVEKAVSIYAVGSITEKLEPLKWGVVDDFMDFTGNVSTFFTGGENGVKHVDMTEVFDPSLSSKLVEYAPVKDNLIYVATAGPRLETRSEINAYRVLGADVVGMTLSHEAVLLKEAGIKNAAIAYSINWACGVSDSVSFVSDDDISALTGEIINVVRRVLHE